MADQQKQLKETQDEVAKDRSDLEGSINSTRDDLNSTRDDLNGSIAKTHDELVALEKRGERAISNLTSPSQNNSSASGLSPSPFAKQTRSISTTTSQ